MKNNKNNKDKRLEMIIEQIHRTYGKGAIMKMGETKAIEGVQVISTGSLQLDMALGIGGVPRGRITEIFGPEASGKTTLALHIIAEAQKKGGIAAFIDAEHALDPIYAKKLGVNIDELLISQPDYGEQALEIAEMLVRSNAVDVIVIDSVAALVPKAEIDGEMGDSHVGLQARLMSQALRKLTAAINKSNTCFIFINQVREKVGVMFGNPEVTTGGRALKFYSTIRMEIRRIATFKEGNTEIGNRVRVKVVKNKLAPPFKTAEFDILFGQGISKESAILEVGTTLDVVTKTGTWYSYNNIRLGQGKINAIRFLQNNPKIAGEIENKIRKIMQENFSHQNKKTKEEAKK